MKIVINAVSAKSGGGITYLVNLLRYLPALMPKDEFLCVVHGIELPHELHNIKNLEIRKLSMSITSVLARYWWENTGLLKLCKKWKADLLFCIANVIPIVPVKIPTIVVIQNVAPLTPKVFFMLKKHEGFGSFMKMLSNTGLTLFASIFSSETIVLSVATQKLLTGYLPFVKSKVIYHGIDGKNFTPKSKRPEKAGNEPYFIYVSNLYVYKGLEYIVEAYESDPTLPKTLIAGFPYDSHYVDNIKKQIKLKNLENKIKFLDEVPYKDLPRWYANAISMVYTSWCENCPNILLEAQSCGCPIVAMDIGPMPELCSKENIIVQPFNGKALAEGMKKAINLRKKPSLVEHLTQYAGKFTWKSAMEKLKNSLHP